MKIKAYVTLQDESIFGLDKQVGVLSGNLTDLNTTAKAILEIAESTFK